MGMATKSLFFYLTRCLGINVCLRHSMRSKLLAVCYHGVVADDHKEDAFRYRNTVSVQVFNKQLETLSRFFNPISASELIGYLEGSTRLPPFPALVTFDDGFRNNLTLAAPVLERYGIPAVFHVTTGYIGLKRRLWPQEVLEVVLHWPHRMIPMPAGEADREVPETRAGRVALVEHIKKQCKHIPDTERCVYIDSLRSDCPALAWDQDDELYGFLSWDDVRKLHQRGFDIGAHTVEHPILTRLSPDRLDAELRGSKTTIEQELGTDCRILAYPNGSREDFSASVQAKAREVGFKIAFTLTQQANPLPPDPYAISRISIVGHVPASVFHSRISGLTARLRG